MKVRFLAIRVAGELTEIVSFAVWCRLFGTGARRVLQHLRLKLSGYNRDYVNKCYGLSAPTKFGG